MADDSQPWANDPIVAANYSGNATTFADQADLVAYRNAKAQGASEEEALKVGDNGVGSKDLGSIATPNAYGVAVPRAQLEQIFGSDPSAWRTARAVVNFNGQNITVPVVDEGPGEKAQANGVVTDFTGPLAKALKSQGMDPVQVSLVRNGGPDYMSDPSAWYSEQQKIRSKLPDAGPWSKDPVVGQPKQTEQSKPWLNDPVVKKPDPQHPWQQDKLGTNHPIAKENGWTLAQSIQNIWDVAKLGNARANYGLAQSQVTTNAPDAMVQQQIDSIKASPYLTEEQKQQNIAALQQGQQKEWEEAHASLPKLKQDIADAEKQIQKDHPNDAEKVLGGVGPYLKSTVAGPLGPIIAAQQASAETYGDVLDTSVKKLKELHPDWNDGKVITQAVKAASEASSGSAEAMLALSAVDVPAAGPIIARIAQKIGIGAATMEVANSFAEVQKNIALKKDVDPTQDWLGQLRNIEFHVQNLATGGAFGGLHGLGGEIGRPSTTPIEDRVPIAEVPEKEEQPKPEAKTEPTTPEPAPVEAKPVTGNDPWLSSIANRYTQPRSEAGEIGPITPGTGTTPEAMLAKGTQMGPEEIAQHVSDLMQDKGNFRDHAAAVRAREAQLSQDSARLSRIAEANPNDPIAQRNAEDAFQHLTDFHNGPVAKLKNAWHAAGEAMQGEIPVDLGSFNGLREAWLRDVGKEPSERVQNTMRDTARKVREAQAAEDIAMRRLGEEIQKPTRRKLPTSDEVREAILKEMNGDIPCGL